MTHSAFRIPHSAFRIAPLLLAWLGYFAPWLWPLPAALRLSGYDLVEWMTFAESVRNGTYPITRLDILYPLAGIALLSAIVVPSFAEKNPPPSREERQEKNTFSSLRALCVFAIKPFPALFASYLILPAYPFILTAPADPELRPQLILAVATGIAALLTVALVRLHPHRATLWSSLTSLISLISLFATVRAFLLIRQPLADILALPAPVGFGFYVAVVGFGLVAMQNLTRLWRDGRMPASHTRV